MKDVVFQCGLVFTTAMILSPCSPEASAASDTERTECGAFHNLELDSDPTGGFFELGFGRSIAVDQGVLLSGDPLSHKTLSNSHLFGRVVLFGVDPAEPDPVYGAPIETGSADHADCLSDDGESTRCSYFGYSVSLKGGLAAVGEPWREGASTRDTGRVTVFRQTSPGATLHELTPSDPRVESGFGRTVVLRDDVLLVGIDGVIDTQGRRGGVEVFDTDGFGSLGILRGPNNEKPLPNDVFGYAIAVDRASNKVLIGSRNDQQADGDSGAGAAHLYAVSAPIKGKPASLEYITKLTVPVDSDDPMTSMDEFGASVAIEGTLAAVGAPGRGFGEVHLFQRDPVEGWVFDRVIEAPNALDISPLHFGRSLEFAGGRLFVGAPGTRFVEGYTGTGAVFSFDLDEASCVRIYRAGLGPLGIPLTERLGYDIEIDGDFLYAGGPGLCCDSARVLAFSIIPADVDFDGTVDVTDLLAVINAWGTCSGCSADINCDGLVNVTDLLEVIAEWRGVRLSERPLHGTGDRLGG